MRGSYQPVTSDVGYGSTTCNISRRQLQRGRQDAKRSLSSRSFLRRRDLPLETGDQRIRLIGTLEVAGGYFRVQLKSEIGYSKSRPKQKADSKGKTRKRCHPGCIGQSISPSLLQCLHNFLNILTHADESRGSDS